MTPASAYFCSAMLSGSRRRITSMLTRVASATRVPHTTPCGMGKKAPSGEASPCTEPSPHCARVMPEASEAQAMRARPSAPSAPPCQAAQKPSRKACMPELARASVKGLARSDTQDSSSWVNASMPLAAIRAGLQLASSSGSISASCATNCSSRKDFLKPSGPRRDSTAFLVASDPVPAVVGTAMKGTAGPG